MPVSEAHKKAVRKYEKKAYTKCTLYLHHVTDAELIQFIESEKASGGSPTTAVRKLYAQRKGE